MRRRILLTIVILLSTGSIAVATFVAQRAAQRAKTPAQTPSARAQQRAGQRNVPAQAGPLRPADPNRAPQQAVDDALYSNEEFFGAPATIARPYSVALERVTALVAQYPKDARLRLHAARLSEKLGQFDRATKEMNEYATLKRRSADALRRLADFYHHRAMFADEVKTLRELALALPVSRRAPVYKRAADVVRSRTLTEFKPADFFAELVAADPSNIQPIKSYVEELFLAKQNQEALAVLAQFQPRFPGELAYFLKTRAQILESVGDRRAAEEVYSTAFDANWPRAVASDYYDLLRRFGRYRMVRRTLQDRVRAGATDLDTTARLFNIFAYEGNYEQAAQLMRDLEARRAGRTSSGAQPVSTAQTVTASQWNQRELGTTAAMLTSIGQYDQASRYLYTLYLVGGLQPGSETREDALYRLFNVLIAAAETPTRVAAGDLSFYKDIAEVDQHPGVINGVLSLILSGYDVPQEFATQEKAAAGYFNRAFAHRIFTAFKQEYAQSNRLGDMYLAVVNVFSSLGEHKLALDAGREFRERYPNSPKFAEVTLRMADSYVALKDRTNERVLLVGLLDRLARSQPKGVPLIAITEKRWVFGSSPAIDQLIDRIKYDIEAYSDTYDPTQGGDDEESSGEESDEGEGYQSDSSSQDKRGPTYSSVLERVISSFAAEEKKTEVVAFFWSEVRKHPRDEGLYERFLRWLGQNEIINEQLKTYNAAIRQFDNNTWYHRLARWYVRQQRGRELARYSRQLIDIFDEEEITEYLLRFAGYGGAAAGDGLNWDEQLAHQLYSHAHNRFPRSLFFVRGMLTHLNKTDEQQWAKLSAQYYFLDRSIREPYLAWLSKQNQLRDRYAQAKQQAASKFTYKVFAADSSLWLSHHDEALDAYRQLASLYPGERQYAERLADLTRSFGQQDAKLYEESAQLFARMADVYPSNHDYRIKAGEVYAQLGDFKRAGDEWDRLTQLEPGERETYLEVATVYWDYYQYDQALRVFADLRNKTGDPSLYAYRMGAVYEGKGDVDAAINEYVKVLNEPGAGRETVAKRLAQLSKRRGLAEKIAAAYQQRRSANPNDWQLTIGYAVYQAERDRQADALALLRSEVARINDVAFLETVRDLFRWLLRPEDEQQVLTRLAAAARDEREAMMYRLQNAAFLERQGKRDDAIAIIDKLVADYPTNVGVIEESAQFYWRAKMTDRALDLYKRSLAQAKGANRRALTLQYARRQMEAGKLADAETTLRAFYNENRADTEVFGELAKTLGAENKLNELAALYEEAFKDARESGLAGDDLKARVADLRAGMTATLDSLKNYAGALDQQIEIINAFPEDADRLARVIDYAEKHNLIDRLAGYYEKLSREAFKNYRWQLVLGRIYERRGNLAGATEQYRIAVTNEPQRSELRFTLASVLARQKRFDEAITVLREGWALAGRDPSWLTEVARIQVQQGKRDEAIQTLRQALAAKKNATADDQFKMATQLASWGIHEEAARFYDEAIQRAIKNFKDEYIGAPSISGYVRSLIRSESVASVYQKAERLRAQFNAIAGNADSLESYKAKSAMSALDEAMRADFGKGVIDYASPAEANAVASAMQNAIARLTGYGDIEQLRRHLGIARAANLVSVEEQIQTQLKDAARSERDRLAPALNTGTPQERARAQTNYNGVTAIFYGELRALVNFYDRHAAYSRAAELLQTEYMRDPTKDRFDYQNQVAMQYRLTGDRTRELDALRRAYAGASGALVATPENHDWIERYLALLHSTGARAELEQLASTVNPHQLQLINFFVEKGEKALAQKAVATLKNVLSPAWASSRSAEVGLFLKDTTPETEAFFKQALDIRAIGQMLDRKVDARQTLVGDDWFVAARNYGYWLALTSQREAESNNYTIGEIEGSPASAQAQLELAAYYLNRKDTTRATNHVVLAAELEPQSKEVIVMRGSIALAKGDRRGALEAWNQLMTGRVSAGGVELYLRVMAGNGFIREALPPVQSFLLAYVNRKNRDEDEDTRIEAVKPIIREIASRAAGDARLTSDVAAFFHTTVTGIPNNYSIGRMLIQEKLLPENALASIYRTIHQRLSDAARAVFGTSEYENGYYSGSEWIYPAKDLAEWRRGFLDYLIRTRSFDEARLLVATIREEQKDLELALEERGEDAPYVEDHYEWLSLAAALVELRAGNDTTKAMAELRRYCGIGTVSGGHSAIDSRISESPDENYNGPLHERCLKAYALLMAENETAEAESLLYDAYSMAARSRFADDASLAGLAEIEARRGNSDEAARLLRQLVERSTDNLKALGLAADTAARIKRYNEAVEFRQQIARINPTDAANKLELARAMAAAGRAQDAINQLAALTAEKMTPNSVRAQAAEVVGEIVRANNSLASQAANAFAAGDANAALARAAISEATGKLDEARSALSTLNSGPLAAVAQMKTGLLSLAAGRDADAVTSFERAIYLDADGLMTDAIAFRAPGPRAQLIVLYSRVGRDAAAIQLAEGDPAGKQSPITLAVRYAIQTGSESSASQSGVAFEPSLLEARAKTDGLRTIAELNEAANAKVGGGVLAALVESAARLGQYDKAVAIARARASGATRPEERAAIERRLAEIMQASNARQQRSAAVLRIDSENTSRSFYAARVAGN